MAAVEIPDYLVPRPPMPADPAALAAFDALFEEVEASHGKLIDYRLELPIWQFLAYLADTRDVLLHGSGNPAIADVSVIDSRHLLVMGRSYGVTNIVVTDARGRTIFNQQVVVSAPDQDRVSFYRGPNLNNYACSPRCERTPMPGEQDAGAYSLYAKPYEGYADRSQGATAPTPRPSPTMPAA